MAWKMSLCRNSEDPLIERTFENFEDAKEWLGANHPALLRADFKRLEGDHRQYGTNYYWASFARL